MNELLQLLPFLQTAPAAKPAAGVAIKTVQSASNELPPALFELLTPPTAPITLAPASAPAAPAPPVTEPTADEIAADDVDSAVLMLALLGAPLMMLIPPASPEPVAPPAAATGSAPPIAVSSPGVSVAPALSLPAPQDPQEKISMPAPTAEFKEPVVAALMSEGHRADAAATLATALPRVDAWLPPAPAAAPAQSANVAQAPAVTVTPEHHEFAERFASSVLWSAGHKLEQAEIQLHPRDLGSVSVSITMRDDQASVSFSAAHPAAREAITQALPVLREMFAQAGMNLAQSQVFEQAPQPRARQALPSPRRSGGDGSGGEVLVAGPRRARRVGLLDDYA